MSIKKRELFYISGYDPRGARHYYSLYKEHSEKQNKLNNLAVSISSRKVTNGVSSWEINSNDNGNKVNTKYNFLSWTDIILQNWSKNILEIMFNFFYSVNAHIFTGLIFKYAKMAPHMLTIGFYTVTYSILLFLLIFFTGYKINIFFLKFVPIYISILPAISAMYFIFQYGMKFGKKIAVFWLFNIYTFTAKWARGKLPNLDRKIEQFSDDIFNKMKRIEEDSIDEVLIVAHSVGSMLSVPILAQVIRKCKVNNIDISKLKLLTLGGDIPLISMQKGAVSYRKDLQYLALMKNFVWVDYTSTIDGTCFPMVDPIKSAGLIRKKGKGPIILSTRFYKLFTKENYKKIRYKWFDVHFLYLMSSDISGEYDYFKITAGSKPLELAIK